MGGNFIVKAKYRGEFRRIEISTNRMSFVDLQTMIDRMFKDNLSPSATVSIYYIDEDFDEIAVSSDDELLLATRDKTKVTFIIRDKAENKELEKLVTDMKMSFEEFGKVINKLQMLAFKSKSFFHSEDPSDSCTAYPRTDEGIITKDSGDSASNVATGGMEIVYGMSRKEHVDPQTSCDSERPVSQGPSQTYTSETSNQVDFPSGDVAENCNSAQVNHDLGSSRNNNQNVWNNDNPPFRPDYLNITRPTYMFQTIGQQIPANYYRSPNAQMRYRAPNVYADPHMNNQVAMELPKRPYRDDITEHETSATKTPNPAGLHPAAYSQSPRQRYSLQDKQSIHYGPPY